MVLTNAVYFKGKWHAQFEKERTRKRDFWVSPDKSIEVQMMSQKHELGYQENESWQMVELPYRAAIW